MNHLPLLLLFAFVGLSGLGFTAFLVVTGQSRQERLRQRFQTATAPHMRMRKIEPVRVIRNAEPEKANSPTDRAARIFSASTIASVCRKSSCLLVLMTR